MTQASSTIRITHEYQEILRKLAKEAGKSMQAIMEEAIEQYQKAKLFEDLDTACRTLKQNPDAWDEELAEQRIRDNTLEDGLKGF